MTVKISSMGTDGWRLFVDVLKAGAALDTGTNRPRGANGVNAYPQKAPDSDGGERGSRLDDAWLPSVRDAERVIYFWSTPIAWTMRDGTWVVPSDNYTSTTTGAQNRVRAALVRAGVVYADLPLTAFADADRA